MCCGFSCCGNAFVLGFGGCFVFDLIGELLVYWFGLLLVEWWFSLGFVSFCYLLVGWLGCLSVFAMIGFGCACFCLY